MNDHSHPIPKPTQSRPTISPIVLSVRLLVAVTVKVLYYAWLHKMISQQSKHSRWYVTTSDKKSLPSVCVKTVLRTIRTLFSDYLVV